MLTKAQIEVHHEISKLFGGPYCDPKYSPAHLRDRHEAIIRGWARENIHRAADFPEWLTAWVARWKAAARAHGAAGHPGDQRAAVSGVATGEG